MEFSRNHEQEPKMYETYCLLENGIGIGEGAISYSELRKSNPEIPEEAFQLAVSAINDCIVEIAEEIDGDGCGDGRRAELVYRERGGREEVLGENKVRPKVLGGGLPVFDEMLNAIDPTFISEPTITASRRRTAHIMQKLGLSYGAHTAQSHGEGKCGCGCLDESAAIIAAQVRYAEQLDGFIAAIVATALNPAEAAHINQSSVRRNNHRYTSDAQGEKTLEIIKRNGKIIKKLSGLHNEAFIILIDEPGKDFDQAKLYGIIAAKYGAEIADRIQAFVVNIAHIRKLAKKAASYVSENSETHYEDLEKTALAAGLKHQLATAIVLTDGSHPVFVRRARQHTAVAA